MAYLSPAATVVFGIDTKVIGSPTNLETPFALITKSVNPTSLVVAIEPGQTVVTKGVFGPANQVTAAATVSRPSTGQFWPRPVYK